MKRLLYIPLMVSAVVLTGCDDMFSPQKENNLGVDYMYQNPTYAEAVLGNAYTRIPYGMPWNDVATDDAVSNDVDNSYRRMATGRWTADNNPIDQWTGCRAAIQYINLFLSKADDVNWANEEDAATLYRDRLKGEAYGLRAMYMYFLLRSHAGYAADGQLLGVPIVTDFQDYSSDFNVPRNTFNECMDMLREDATKAISLLPTEYGDAESIAKLQQRYPGIPVGQFERVYGAIFLGRISGRIVEAILSQAELLAASPAFSADSGVTYETAANCAATVLDRVGGVSGLDPDGWWWYCNQTQIDGLGNGVSPAEVLWRTEKSSGRGLEEENYPPTLYGRGRINPTQNLVDAFPMANGYPIDNSLSGYDAANPYDGRDPRLERYIVHNGTILGVNNTAINTASDGGTNDGLNKVSTSTRTGYYMKKHLYSDMNLDPNTATNRNHYTSRIRMTEIFLNYAEAANEAWGPTGTGSHAYSAYDVIKAIRKRAGVGTDNGDPYLESIKSDKEKMRQLIRNERRLELCFEGFRFFDLRRWKAPLNETAKGVNISNGRHNVIDVDTRNFKDYMYYGPIPYSEILKFDALQQNAGW